MALLEREKINVNQKIPGFPLAWAIFIKDEAFYRAAVVKFTTHDQEVVGLNPTGSGPFYLSPPLSLSSVSLKRYFKKIEQ